MSTTRIERKEAARPSPVDGIAVRANELLGEMTVEKKAIQPMRKH